jgi:hypothetical protein
MTNSDYPGLTLRVRTGSTWEVGLSGEYDLTPRWSLDLDAYGGQIYWKGSGWTDYGTGVLVKWPKNLTTFIGGILSVSCKLGGAAAQPAPKGNEP